MQSVSAKCMDNTKWGKGSDVPNCSAPIQGGLGCRSGTTETSWSSAKAMSWIWWGRIPSHCSRGQAGGWLVGKKCGRGGSWGNEDQQYAGLHWEYCQQVKGGDLLLIPGEDTPSAVPSSGLLSTRETWTCWSESSDRPQRGLRGQNIFDMTRGWEICDCLYWRREGWRGSYEHIQISEEGKGNSQTQWYPVTGQEAMGTNLNTEPQHLNTRKNPIFDFFSSLPLLRVVEHSNRLNICPGKLWNLCPWRYSKFYWT